MAAPPPTRVPSSLPVVFVLRGDQFAVLTSGETQVDLTEYVADAVTSWNGRTGAVLPQTGDYTAAQVGATTASQVDDAIAAALAAEPAKPLAQVLAAGATTGGTSLVVSAGDFIAAEGDLFIAPGPAPGDHVYLGGMRWPGSDGAAGSVLTTDGAGGLTLEPLPAVPATAWGTITGTLGDQADLAAALALLAPLASPTFTGVPRVPTALVGTNDTTAASTAFVTSIAAAETAARVAADALLAPLNSAVLTGDPRAPTPAPGDNDTSIATTAFVALAASTAATTAIGTPTGPVVGTTSAPMAPGAFAVVPEMTTSFTPVRTWCWVDFECVVTLAPAAIGATIGADFRITVNGVAVPASTRRTSMTADSLLALAVGSDTRLFSMRRRITGLTAGVPVTIAVEWMEVAGNNGTVTARLVERSLTVSGT